MKKNIFKLTALLSFAWLIPNCANFTTNSQFGSVYTSVKFPNQNFKIKAIPSNTSIISIEISGKGLTDPIKVNLTKDNPSILIPDVPAGEKVVLAIARDIASKKLAEGTGSINVIAGKSNSLEITLKDFSSGSTTSESNESPESEANETPEDEIAENHDADETGEEASENDPNEATETPEDELAEEASENELEEDGGGGGGSGSTTPRVSTSITINEGSLISPN
ncbi:MAG: hypothetical protein ACK4IX_18130, partial [Candidatus Sericytochromatia bacterium]